MDEKRFRISTNGLYTSRNQLGVCITNLDGYPLTTPNGTVMPERLSHAEALQMLDLLLGGVPAAGRAGMRRWEDHYRYGNVR